MVSGKQVMAFDGGGKLYAAVWFAEPYGGWGARKFTTSTHDERAAFIKLMNDCKTEINRRELPLDVLSEAQG